jgi:hypothetical protein
LVGAVGATALKGALFSTNALATSAHARETRMKRA